MDRTVLAFMAREVGRATDGRGKAKWNLAKPPRVIAFNINAPSMPYLNSASAHNVTGAAFVMWLRTQLLAAPAPSGGRPVDASDIAIMSPYRGQVQYIRDKFRRPQEAESLATTVRKVQGAECQIGISPPRTTRRTSLASASSTRRRVSTCG